MAEKPCPPSAGVLCWSSCLGRRASAFPAWRIASCNAASHCGLTEDAWELPDPAAWRRRLGGRDWKADMSRREDGEEMEEMRRHTRTGRPLAGKQALDWLERETGRRLRTRPVARPRKEEK